MSVFGCRADKNHDLAKKNGDALFGLRMRIGAVFAVTHTPRLDRPDGLWSDQA